MQAGKEGEKDGVVEIYGWANNFISQLNIDKRAITKNVIKDILGPKKKIPRLLKVKAFEIFKTIMYYINLAMEVMNVLSCRPKCTIYYSRSFGFLMPF